MHRRHALAYFMIPLFIVAFQAVLVAQAKFVSKVGTRTDSAGIVYLVVNGRDAASFRTPNAGLTPTQRAEITAQRLAQLTQKGLDPAALGVKKSGQNVRIVAGETLIFVATAAEAKAQKTTPMDLASAWVRNIRKLLTMPPISVEPSTVMVPVGETRSVAVQSLVPDQLQVEVSDAKVLSFDLKKKPGFIILTGLTVGDAKVTLKCQDYAVSVDASVRKYAAAVASGTAKATVTGISCPASLMVQAARAAALQAVTLEPGAKLAALSTPPSVKSIPPGQVTQIPVIVEATGQGYLPLRMSIPVQVENTLLTKVPSTWIMYSNNPETVHKYQHLFAGRLETKAESTRLLYHHQNMMDRKIGFVIDVVNPSSVPADLHVIEGVSAPMVDTVIVGYVAGREFMENQRNAVGRIYRIPPGSRQVILTQGLPSQQTASGIMELRQLCGNPLFLRVIAEPEEQRLAEDTSEVPVPTSGMDPSKVALSEHIYPNPVQDVDVTYTAGKPWVFLRIGGKDSLKHATENLTLYGNYGVNYEIKARLENPSELPVTAEVAFEPTAGPASAIFYMDGDPIRIKYLTPPTEYTIGRITIPAGQTKNVSIRTIPLSGSAYPATLIIRPAGTVSATGG